MAFGWTINIFHRMIAAVGDGSYANHYVGVDFFSYGWLGVVYVCHKAKYDVRIFLIHFPSDFVAEIHKPVAGGKPSAIFIPISGIQFSAIFAFTTEHPVRRRKRNR